MKKNGHVIFSVMLVIVLLFSISGCSADKGGAAVTDSAKSGTVSKTETEEPSSEKSSSKPNSVQQVSSERSAPSNSSKPTEVSSVADSPETSSAPTVDTPKYINLMKNITPSAVSGKAADDAFISGQMNFALELFKKTVPIAENPNPLVSPLSVQLAFAMLANGAEGETKREMENLLGGGIKIEQLNEYLYTYVKNLYTDESNKLNIANSIWINDIYSKDIENSFLQTNADYYGAAAYKAPFDQKTLDNINSWVKKKTDGTIEKIFEHLDVTEVICLINTLLFEADWQNGYGEYGNNITFTSISGEERTVKAMQGQESKFISDGSAKGFIKDYKGGKYSFAALIPNEDVNITDYINSLTAQGVFETLNNVNECKVFTQMPMFNYDCEYNLVNILTEMGMPSAFKASANFTKIDKSGGLFVNVAVHKTHIEVNEKGTKVSAATGIRMTKSLKEYDERVILDRPFVYMIIDNSTKLPIFMGAVMDIGE